MPRVSRLERGTTSTVRSPSANGHGDAGHFLQVSDHIVEGGGESANFSLRWISIFWSRSPESPISWATVMRWCRGSVMEPAVRKAVQSPKTMAKIVPRITRISRWCWPFLAAFWDSSRSG